MASLRGVRPARIPIGPYGNPRSGGSSASPKASRLAVPFTPRLSDDPPEGGKSVAIQVAQTMFPTLDHSSGSNDLKRGQWYTTLRRTIPATPWPAFLHRLLLMSGIVRQNVCRYFPACQIIATPAIWLPSRFHAVVGFETQLHQLSISDPVLIRPS